LSPSPSLLLLAKTITHPAAQSLCDNWASCYLSANKVVFYCYWNTVCNEIARCYNGNITKGKNVVMKHCDLKNRWVHGVRWRKSHRRNGPESALTHSSIKTDAFYSKLTGAGTSDEDYEHAKTVWCDFDCKTLRDFLELYNKSDVLILCVCVFCVL